VSKLVKVPLSQNQFDALVSFEYNVGYGNFSKSTLLRKLNLKDYIGASKEFDKWVYANKKKLTGLVKRRKSEKELFLKK
jgi:lysozyme